ncbi:hypothetical protein [Streptomyces formicae]|uniref:hypothetical protein n=1 Tax=Streptomyces formicae TaxID=1616117 RepID=UPI001F569E84|nr:hypothetical protein [Streptomyces formicae]
MDTAARLLAYELADTGWYERWNLLPFPNGIRVSDRGESLSVSMCFRSQGAYVNNPPRWYSMPVSASEPVEDQVRHFVEKITAADPRETAQRF